MRYCRAGHTRIDFRLRVWMLWWACTFSVLCTLLHLGTVRLLTTNLGLSLTYKVICMNDSIYYDFETLLTKNALINFTLSNRGAGKTFGFKKYAIRDFLKTGWQFVYMRRYQTELNTISSFFDDIQEFFPDHEFAVKGGKKGGKFLIDDKIAGFFVPLSSTLAFKSTPFSHVNKICYDEFLIPKGSLRYLTDEVHNFFDFIETVNRYRDTDKLHDLVRIFCFANTISIINPYFREFNLAVDTGKRFNIYKEYDNDVIVEIFKNDEFVKRKSETRIGKIMNKTPYGSYAIEGEFYQDSETFIEKHPKGTKAIVCIRYAEKIVYFYFDMKNGKIYASYDEQIDVPWKFTLTSDDHTPNYYLVKSANACGQTRVLTQVFANGCMRFDDLDVKETTYRILQCLGVKGR